MIIINLNKTADQWCKESATAVKILCLSLLQMHYCVEGPASMCVEFLLKPVQKTAMENSQNVIPFCA